MLIDTYRQLDYSEFEQDRAEVISHTPAFWAHLMNVWAAVGIHYLEAQDAPCEMIEQLREMAQHPRVVATGEIGLDYFQIDPVLSEKVKLRQKMLFHEQLVVAARQKLNVILHQRGAWEDTLKIMKHFTGKLRGVFHRFKGTLEQVKQITEMGHLVFFTKMATFPEMPQTAATASVIPSGQFMLETDSPFHMTPPDRNGRCEPQQTRCVAEFIAHLRGVSLEKLAEETSRMARNFFRLRKPALVS